MTPLLALPYLPPVSWWSVAWPAPVVRLEAHEHFQKGSYRNRCHLAGANGLQRLSIPLLHGKNQKMPIRDVRIAYDEPWPQVHWRSIAAAYGNAPFFEHYAAGLAAFYTRRHTFLFDLNLELLEFFCRKLAWEGRVELTEGFEPPDPPQPYDFRFVISPGTEFYPAGFRPAPYAQVFMERHGFLPDLSVLDLLMCTGKRSGEILRQSVV
jgi:hypothetical protein